MSYLYTTHSEQHKATPRKKHLLFLSKLVKSNTEEAGVSFVGLSNHITSTSGLGGRREEKERKQILARDRKESLERLWNDKCAFEV